MNTPSKITGVKKVSISPITGRHLMDRYSLFEPENLRVVNHFKPELNPTTYMRQGPSTIFTIPTPAGRIRYTVDTKLDEEEQHKALVRFNYKFRKIQEFFINELRSDQLTRDRGHNGQWMCVTAGDGKWYPSGPRQGSWKMSPKEVKCDAGAVVTDEFVKSQGQGWISSKNDANIFCVPEKYKLQIQGQLAVCNLKECDYIECKFLIMEENIYIEEFSNKNTNHGIIAEYIKNSTKEYHYLYSDDDINASEAIDNIYSKIADFNIDNEKNGNKYEFVKFNYWKLDKINVQRIIFDNENWKNINEKINIFWEKVENYKKLPIDKFKFINDDDDE